MQVIGAPAHCALRFLLVEIRDGRAECRPNMNPENLPRPPPRLKSQILRQNDCPRGWTFSEKNPFLHKCRNRPSKHHPGSRARTPNTSACSSTHRVFSDTFSSCTWAQQGYQLPPIRRQGYVSNAISAGTHRRDSQASSVVKELGLLRPGAYTRVYGLDS